MIGYLKGTVLVKEEGLLLVETGGVGFEVSPSLEAYEQAAEPGGEAEFFVHTLLRENDISLYGFATRSEKALFELVMGVTGVGPRLALVVVSQLGEEAFIQAVLTANPQPLTRIKGIGKKTAEQIILDLKVRVTKLFSVGGLSTSARPPMLSGGLLETQEALVSLGCRPPEVQSVLGTLRDMKDAPVEELIREGLKRLRK